MGGGQGNCPKITSARGGDQGAPFLRKRLVGWGGGVDTIRHFQGWAFLVPNTLVTVPMLPVQPSVPNRGGYMEKKTYR